MRLGRKTFVVIAAAAGAVLSTLSCGPTVVVAKLATPVAQAPPETTATPRVERQAIPRPPPSPTAAAPPTATATRAFTQTPTATSTKTPRPAAAIPAPTSTASPIPPATATPVPRQPTSSPIPTPAPISPSPAPAARETSPAPPPPPSAAASVPGEWEFRADAGKGIITGTLKFRSAPSGLTGVYVGLHGNTTELSNLHATGAGVSFDLVTPTALWHLDGTISGDRIDGTFQTAERQIRWTAIRKPAAPSATPRS